MTLDIYQMFNVFMTQESGLIILAVFSLMEFIIKPILKRLYNGGMEKQITKKTFLPLLVLVLSILGALCISPPLLGTISAKIIYGLGVGLVANFLYRSSISSLLKNIGLQQKIQDSVFPPKTPPEE